MATATDIDAKVNRLCNFNLAAWAKERKWWDGMSREGIGCLFCDGSNYRDRGEGYRIADAQP